ncbi:hypothetical protein [Hymenobacter algoricola]|uniref:hypothetical protein n=1 Tax=Hymenobacter algoricola TaxID=486267 RepID=UPI0031EEFEBB
MNPSNETLKKLEEEYNQVLREHNLQSEAAFNRIKAIQKRMLKSSDLTILLSASKIKELEAQIDGSTLHTMREFMGALSRAKSTATMDKTAEEARNRMMNR